MVKEIKYRHEYKHYINIADYLAIRQRLSLIANPDSHAGPDGKYRIRSLYFETPDDKNLKEKLYGLNNREKFRIRYYNDDTDFIRLEKKTKVNGFGNKISAPITKEECEKLIAGDTEWMRNSEHPLILELYAKMKFQLLHPKTIVDYIREPFIYNPGNVRVTIDSEIETGINSKDLFNQNLPTVRSNAGNVIILEVKYDEFLPEIIKVILQTKNRKSTAFSKYAACRVFG
ncbi:MAG: polyphosphate polymerase domain-containing protein [Clostridiaceae bacterium]